VALLISSTTNIGDLYMMDVASRDVRRLTKINDDLFSKLNITEPAMIWYNSFDGKRIQTWVQRPPDFRKARNIP